MSWNAADLCLVALRLMENSVGIFCEVGQIRNDFCLWLGGAGKNQMLYLKD